MIYIIKWVNICNFMKKKHDIPVFISISKKSQSLQIEISKTKIQKVFFTAVGWFSFLLRFIRENLARIHNF